MAPTCSNCGASDFVWANELKTGLTGGGTLSLRPRGEIPVGTRICRACGHADLFLRELGILHQPNLWRPGEFIPIAPKPAPAAAHHTAHHTSKPAAEAAPPPPPSPPPREVAPPPPPPPPPPEPPMEPSPPPAPEPTPPMAEPEPMADPEPAPTPEVPKPRARRPAAKRSK
ncbi:MAG: hypothetical protein L3J97_04765 [Thermoplasmata archaeon]|nr:hypothetical protein [Thermoplasmata archaeon]